MSTNLVVNGVSYPYPQTGDELWGDPTTNWAIAVTNGMLQKAGGTFTLTADVNFGASFGLVSTYFKSRSSNIAQSGQVRLARTDSVSWRNVANGADLALTVDGSNNLTFNGNTVLVASGGALVATQGGTGQTSYAQGDTLYASAINTLSKLTIGASGTFLKSNGTVPAWAALAASDILSGTLATDRGGTNLDTSASTGVPKIAAGVWSIIAKLAETLGGTNQSTYAQGDMLYASAADTLSKLTVGSANKVLVTNGTVPSWALVANANIDSAAAIAWTKLALFSPSQVVLDSPNGHGSTNTKIRRWTNSTTTGSDLTYADSATLGMTVTCNTAGIYAVSYVDFDSGSTVEFGISVNSSQLTTAIQSITTADRLHCVTATISRDTCVSTVVRLAVNDVVRTHTDGTPSGTGAARQFRIVRIA